MTCLPRVSQGQILPRKGNAMWQLIGSHEVGAIIFYSRQTGSVTGCGLFWIPYKEAKLEELSLTLLKIGFSLLRTLRVTLSSCFSSPDASVSLGGFHGVRLDLAGQVGHCLESLAEALPRTVGHRTKRDIWHPAWPA